MATAAMADESDTAMVAVEEMRGVVVPTVEEVEVELAEAEAAAAEAEVAVAQAELAEAEAELAEAALAEAEAELAEAEAAELAAVAAMPVEKVGVDVLRAEGEATIARRAELAAAYKAAALKLDGQKAIARRAELAAAYKVSALKLDGQKAIERRAEVAAAYEAAALNLVLAMGWTQANQVAQELNNALKAPRAGAEQWPALGGGGAWHPMRGPWPKAAAREQWVPPLGWTPPTKPVLSWYDLGVRLAPAEAEAVEEASFDEAAALAAVAELAETAEEVAAAAAAVKELAQALEDVVEEEAAPSQTISAAGEPPAAAVVVDRFEDGYWQTLLRQKAGEAPAADKEAVAVKQAAPSSSRPSSSFQAKRERTIAGFPAPHYLDETLVADAAFDPLCLVPFAHPYAPSAEWSAMVSVYDRMEVVKALPAEQVRMSLSWMREAEVKHGRIAMAAAVGWPLAELLRPSIGRVPSLLNGGLPAVFPFLFLVAHAAAYVELRTLGSVADNPKSWRAHPKGYLEGQLGFDPLGLYSPEWRASEVHNGRLAMLAITGFAVQEFVWGTPVVEQTRFFFGPLAWFR